MHLSDILDMSDDPSYNGVPVPTDELCRSWSTEEEGEEVAGTEADEQHPESPEDTLERLIDASLEKIHRLQTTSRKDERKRVLVVNMLHRLLLLKMDMLQNELARETRMDIDSGRVTMARMSPKQEAAGILNRLLQEKIGYLGYNRTVRISVEAPSRPGQNAQISCPQKGSSRRAPSTGNSSGSENGSIGKVDQKNHKMGESLEGNSAAPSEREPKIRF